MPPKLELLEQEEAKDNIWLQNIRYETEKMRGLITELLTLARLEQSVLCMEKLDFSHVLLREILPFESMAYEKDIALQYEEIEPDVMLFGNGEQLSRLTAVLLENAIEHSGKGERVYVKWKAGQKKAVLSVTNTGAEISPEQAEHLFDRFYQTDFSRSDDGGHYGLGLAIAKKIAELHNAEIAVFCEKKCVTFVVTFCLP